MTRGGLLAAVCAEDACPRSEEGLRGKRPNSAATAGPVYGVEGRTALRSTRTCSRLCAGFFTAVHARRTARDTGADLPFPSPAGFALLPVRCVSLLAISLTSGVTERTRRPRALRGQRRWSCGIERRWEAEGGRSVERDKMGGHASGTSTANRSSCAHVSSEREPERRVEARRQRGPVMRKMPFGRCNRRDVLRLPCLERCCGPLTMFLSADAYRRAFLLACRFSLALYAGNAARSPGSITLFPASSRAPIPLGRLPLGHAFQRMLDACGVATCLLCRLRLISSTASIALAPEPSDYTLVRPFLSCVPALRQAFLLSVPAHLRYKAFRAGPVCRTSDGLALRF